jgi:ADP-ribose pyrophosphatase YjhB (NUDIX family)
MSVVEARELAVRAHAGQRDRDGSFHIAHVARVAERVPREAPFQRVAWLHDVVEDSPLVLEELRLSDAEREAIALLTHDRPEPYQQYVERIVTAAGQAGDLARSIKEADMLDNLRRCAVARDEAVGQYGLALSRLWSAGPWSRSMASPLAASPGASDAPCVTALTVKGVCADDRERILLCLNHRGEWELPGGRPYPGENYSACLAREIEEETGLLAAVRSLITAFPYEVVPDGWVHVLVFGCDLDGSVSARHSPEHRAVEFFSAEGLGQLPLADGYRDAISSWIVNSPP